MSLNILDCYKKHWQLNNDKKIKIDHEIYKKFIKTINNISTNKYFLIYWCQENEPDTMQIIKYLLSTKRKVCLLNINSKKQINYYAINSLDFEYEYLWNIKMPKPNIINKVEQNQISCVILPAIAFNNKNEILIYKSNEMFLPLLKNNNLMSFALSYKFSEYNDIVFDKKTIVNMIIHNN